jgi:hypothetical protein
MRKQRSLLCDSGRTIIASGWSVMQEKESNTPSDRGITAKDKLGGASRHNSRNSLVARVSLKSMSESLTLFFRRMLIGWHKGYGAISCQKNTPIFLTNDMKNGTCI